MRKKGILTQWDDGKGYGFITPSEGGARLFVHIKAFGLRAQRPRPGELLSYEPGQDARGTSRALKVRAVAAPSPPPSSGRSSNTSLWLIPAFAACFLLVQLLWPLPRALWGVYMAMSLATFVVYWGDRRAARLGRWRVSEASLHGLALACGWPGALLARQLLRHKTSKRSFIGWFWLTVAGNWILFILLGTPLMSAMFGLHF